MYHIVHKCMQCKYQYIFIINQVQYIYGSVSHKINIQDGVKGVPILLLEIFTCHVHISGNSPAL